MFLSVVILGRFTTETHAMALLRQHRHAATTYTTPRDVNESREVLRPSLETTPESPAHFSTGTDTGCVAAATQDERRRGLAVWQAQSWAWHTKVSHGAERKQHGVPLVTARSPLPSCSGPCLGGGPRGPVPMGAGTSTTPMVSTCRTGHRRHPQAPVTVGRQCGSPVPRQRLATPAGLFV